MDPKSGIPSMVRHARAAESLTHEETGYLETLKQSCSSLRRRREAQAKCNFTGGATACCWAFESRRLI